MNTETREHLNRDGLFVGPSQVETFLQTRIWKTEVGSRLCERVGLSRNSHRSIVSRVVVLNSAIRPVAVLWGVMSIVVSALYRVTWWAWSHVCVKRGEIVPPSVAHRDTSPAVAAVVLNGFVVAPLFGVTPCGIFTSSSHPMNAVTVYAETAATALLLSSCQNISPHNDISPAITDAIPGCATANIGGTVNNDQASESLSRQIVKTHNMGIVT